MQILGQETYIVMIAGIEKELVSILLQQSIDTFFFTFKILVFTVPFYLMKSINHELSISPCNGGLSSLPPRQ